MMAIWTQFQCAAVAVMLLLMCDSAMSFIPTPNMALAGQTPPTQAHTDLMDVALRRVAETLMARYPDQYEDPSKTLSSSSFKQALKQFKAAVALPDKQESDVVEAHCDNEDFAACVDRLISFRQSVIASLWSGKTASMESARELAGRALHGLQDFYSHSNWIEMGNLAPYPNLGQQRIPETMLAGKSEATCVDCRDDDGDVSSTGECRGNIVATINSNRLLTSGYYSTKRTGIETNKCRHGGLTDKDVRTTPTGGINKDTADAKWSPHSYLHETAATLAIDSTVEFLGSIREAVYKDDFDVIADEDFAEFLGIPVGSATTLCFVVDTTGSMKEEIAAVRSLTIRMTQAASTSSGSLRPSDYLLSPFNDPDYGPLFKTTNATTMIAALTGLTANGGRDEPELAFHGLQSALENVRVGSTCYMFTDAPAKDDYLHPVVLSLALAKKVKITLFYTGRVYPRRRRSANRRTKRATFSYYDDLAERTGGSVLPVSNADIESAVDIVRSDSAGLQVVVFTADDIVGGFSFYVDETMTDIYVRLSDSYSSLKTIEFTSPTGEVYVDYTTVLDLTSVKLYNMTTLQPGLWQANVTTTYTGRPFSVEVTAQSLVSFTYQFALLNEGAHSGYIAIAGNPIAGTSYYVVVDVFGAFDPVTDAPTNAVTNVSAILFVSQNGTVISKHDAYQLLPLKQYVVSTVLPSTGFRVAIEGTDAAGRVLRRFDQSLISAVVIKLDIKVVGESSFSLIPGQSVNVSVNVTSVGTSATWYIRVSDTESFYEGSSPISVHLNKDESEIVYLTFLAALNASYGTVSTATVTAGTSSTSSVENFEVFYLNVKYPHIDDEPPACVVDHVEGLCSGTRPTSETPECNGINWSVQFHTQDVGSGLKSVSVKPLLTKYAHSLEVDTFNGTTNAKVDGTYTATCCYPNVTINSIDISGNLGSCIVYNDPISPSCTVVTNQGGCESSYSSDAECRADTWQTTLNVFDAGSGLRQTTVDTDSTDYTLDQTALVYGSVATTDVTFRSSCCHKTAEITVYDLSGNNATCRLVAGVLDSPDVPDTPDVPDSAGRSIMYGSSAVVAIAVSLISMLLPFNQHKSV